MIPLPSQHTRNPPPKNTHSLAGWIPPEIMGLESLTTLRLYRNFNLSGECASKREKEQRLLLALFDSCPVLGRLDARDDSNTRQ